MLGGYKQNQYKQDWTINELHHYCEKLNYLFARLSQRKAEPRLSNE